MGSRILVGLRIMIVYFLLVGTAAISSPFFFDRNALNSVKELTHTHKSLVLAKLIRLGEHYVGIVGIFFFGIFVVVLPQAVFAAFDCRNFVVKLLVIVIYIAVGLLSVFVVVVELSPKTFSKLFVNKTILKDEYIAAVCTELNKVYAQCCPNEDSQRKDLEGCITHFAKLNDPTVAHKVTTVAISGLLGAGIVIECLINSS